MLPENTIESIFVVGWKLVKAVQKPHRHDLYRQLASTALVNIILEASKAGILQQLQDSTLAIVRKEIDAGGSKGDQNEVKDCYGLLFQAVQTDIERRNITGQAERELLHRILEQLADYTPARRE
jgi:hypothetical protein